MLFNILRPYILAFIAIFIAVDIISNVELFLSLTERLSHKQKKRVIRESIFYALLITVIFIWLAKYLFKFMGIAVSDFKIAAGIILLAITINLLLKGRALEPLNQHRHFSDLEIFPLALPVIVGPALFTMSFMVLEEFGAVALVLALAMNMFLVWCILERAETIHKIIGLRGVNSFSKIIEILLVTVSIMWIRQGIIVAFYK